ncbi:MAG TPA: Uma2 family endonuclease [Thermoanaerobaculia bacterium]|nr:Uma2 family endonuclease [Thermoanaerobaculia bacterium]
MALHDPTVRLTYEDYVLIPEDGRRHEVLDGEHYVSAAPFVKHQSISGRLNQHLSNFLDEHDLGSVYAAPIDVLLSPHDIVQPDLVFVSNERAGILKTKNIEGAPDLLIEILSDSTRRIDEGIKLQRYEHFGVREYWLVDPRRETVRIYRLTESGFELAAGLSKDETLSTPLMPGLALPLVKIFR